MLFLRKKNIMTLFIALTLLLATSIFFINQKGNLFHKKTVTITDKNKEDSKKTSSTSVQNNENEEEVNSDEQDTDIHQDDKDDPNKNENKELAEFIAHYHGVLNDITSYNRYENIDWMYMQSVVEELTDGINQILSNEDTYPASMKIDLERVVLLGEISVNDQDSIAVVYIHRILHDLDVEYNGYIYSKYGFSNYDSGGENQQTVVKHIEKYRK